MSALIIDAHENDEDASKRIIWRVAKLQMTPSMPADYYAEIKRIVAEFRPEDMMQALMHLVSFHSGLKWDGERLIVAELGGCSID